MDEIVMKFLSIILCLNSIVLVEKWKIIYRFNHYFVSDSLMTSLFSYCYSLSIFFISLHLRLRSEFSLSFLFALMPESVRVLATLVAVNKCLQRRTRVKNV